MTESPLARVSYATSLEEVLWGTTLIAVTMAIHGFGMLLTLDTNQRLKQRAPLFLSRGIGGVIVASWMILLVHLLELVVWATFFLWQRAMPNASTAYYFSLMQYTTVGSRFSLPERWRLLDGLLPMAGLLTFAWSTGVLFSLAQDFQSSRLSLLHKRRADHAGGSSREGVEP